MRNLPMLFGLSMFARTELSEFYTDIIKLTNPTMPKPLPPTLRRQPPPPSERPPLKLVHSRPERPQSSHGLRRSCDTTRAPRS